jgi:hypothetical protein
MGDDRNTRARYNDYQNPRSNGKRKGGSDGGYSPPRDRGLKPPTKYSRRSSPSRSSSHDSSSIDDEIGHYAGGVGSIIKERCA